MAKVTPPKKPFQVKDLHNRLTKQQMWDIKDSELNNGQLSRKYNISVSTVQKIKKGRFDLQIRYIFPDS